MVRGPPRRGAHWQRGGPTANLPSCGNYCTLSPLEQAVRRVCRVRRAGRRLRLLWWRSAAAEVYGWCCGFEGGRRGGGRARLPPLVLLSTLYPHPAQRPSSLAFLVLSSSSATRYRKGRFDFPRIWLVDRTKSLFTINSGGLPRVCTYTQGHVRNANRQFPLFMQTQP